MIRLLLRLIGIRDFETCQSCETLKQQLAFERAEKQQLTETLLNIIQPKVVEAAPVEIAQTSVSTLPFSRRRAALESRDREAAKILRESPNVARPDSVTKNTPNEVDNKIEALEKELEIEGEKTQNG